MNEASSISVMSSRNAAFYGVSFNTRDRTTRRFAREGFLDELQDQDTFSWIDIEGQDIEALNDLLRQLNIDLVLVSNFSSPEILPRLVTHPDCLAFYLYLVKDPEAHLDSTRRPTRIEHARMILVLSRDYIITYHRAPLRAVDEVKTSCEENFRLAGKTTGFIAFLFLNQCLYDYAHLNLANDNHLDNMEAGAVSGDPTEMAKRISIASSNILTLKKVVSSLHIILMSLVTKRSRFISDESRESFNQMLQNTLAIRASIDSSRDLLGGIVGELQARAANRLSKIAGLLTIVSVVFLPLSLVAGIYGMNTEMPELKRALGFSLVAAILAVLLLVLAATIRRLWRAGKGLAGAEREVQMPEHSTGGEIARS